MVGDKILDRIIKLLTLTLLKVVALLLFAIHPSMADPSLTKRMEHQIGHYENELKRLQQEYEFTRHKRETSERKLQANQREYQDKQVQLSLMKSQVGESVSAVQRDAIANEQKRLTLISIGIESQQSAFERLRKKEEELLLQIEKNQQSISEARKEIDRAEYAQRIRIQTEAQQMAQELERLRLENERLKLEMEEQARKAEEAKTQADAIAEDKARQETTRLEAQRIAVLELLLETQAGGTLGQLANSLSNETNDHSQTVLPGEPPIHQDGNDSNVVLRSRTLEKAYPMKKIGPHNYQTEVVIEPGQEKAYFDVKNRRFRGRFPESDEAVTYVFTLDVSEETRPSLDLRRKGSDEQMASHADVPL